MRPIAGIVAEIPYGCRIRAVALVVLLIVPQRLLEIVRCVHADQKFGVFGIAVKCQCVKFHPGMLV